MMMRWRSLRAIALALMVAAITAHAQTGGDIDDVTPRTTTELLPAGSNALTPYAGKYEARMGSSYEFQGSRLRLDIGGSADLVRITRSTPGSHDSVSYTIGGDFFTWTRLRATSSFKFPVEAVDYFFGVNSTVMWGGPAGYRYGARVRVAHISAHIADGDPSFTDPTARYMTYSREFVDALAEVMIGEEPRTAARTNSDGKLSGRLYAGALLLFHTIPDTLGRVTPYVGAELLNLRSSGQPFNVRLAYEARLNTELSLLLEHEVRLGVSLMPYDRRGVSIEAAYYYGRSHYGQHFSEVERYMSLGFAVDL